MKYLIIFILSLIIFLQYNAFAQPFTATGTESVTSISSVTSCGTDYTFSFGTNSGWWKRVTITDNGSNVTNATWTVSGLGFGYCGWSGGDWGKGGGYDNTTLYCLINPTAKTLTFSTTAPVCVGPLTVGAGTDKKACQNGGDVTLGGSPTASLGTTPYTYAWAGSVGAPSVSGNVANPTISPSSYGTFTYTVTVTDNTASTDSDELIVTINQLPTASNNGPKCVGTTVSLPATPNGGTYAWSGPASFSSTSQNPTRSTLTTSHSGVYTVTVTINSLGCTATTNLTVNSLPTITASCQYSSICIGNSTNLSSSGGNTYNWNTTQTGTPISVSPVSNTTYTVTGTDGNGCSNTATTSVVVISTPTASNNGPKCIGTTLTTDVTPSASSYSWVGPNSFTSTNKTPTVSASATIAMGGTYTVTITAASGCTQSASTTVTVNSLPTPAISGTSNSSICAAAVVPVTLTASGGISYVWSDAGSNPHDVSPTTNTTYTVTATDANGCSQTATHLVRYKTAGPDQSIVAPANATLTASGGTTYTWSDAGANPHNVSPVSTTTYTATIDNSVAGSCVDEIKVTVNIYSCNTCNVTIAAGAGNYTTTANNEEYCLPSGTWTGNITFNHTGTKVCIGGTWNTSTNYTITQSGTIIDNVGTIDMNSALTLQASNAGVTNRSAGIFRSNSLTFNDNSSYYTNDGWAYIDGTATATNLFRGTLTNNGTFISNGWNAIEGLLDNNSGAILVDTSSSEFKIKYSGGTTINDGVIRKTSGTINFEQSFNNKGQIKNLGDGTFAVQSGAAFSNSGVLTYSGITNLIGTPITNTGIWTNNYTAGAPTDNIFNIENGVVFTNSGTITNAEGKIKAIGNITNTGNFISTNGSLELNNNVAFSNTGSFSVGGSGSKVYGVNMHIQNGGQLTIQDGDLEVKNNGDYLVNHGVITLQGAGRTVYVGGGGSSYIQNYGKLIAPNMDVGNTGLMQNYCLVQLSNNFIMRTTATGVQGPSTASGYVANFDIGGNSTWEAGGGSYFGQAGQSIDFCDAGLPAGGWDTKNGHTEAGTVTYCTQSTNGDAECDALLLPIKLLYFRVACDGVNQMKFYWATKTETNNEFFQIERYDTTLGWVEIKRIHGARNSSVTRYYSWFTKPDSGYFRLKQIDYDGQFEVFESNLVYINGCDANLIEIKQCNSLITITGQIESLELYAMDGRCVYTGQTNLIKIDQYSSGIYMVKVISNNKIYNKKILINQK